MSKFRIGNYPTGETRFMYFRKTKHHYRTLIRKKMWIANSIKEESAFNKMLL